MVVPTPIRHIMTFCHTMSVQLGPIVKQLKSIHLERSSGFEHGGTPEEAMQEFLGKSAVLLLDGILRGAGVAATLIVDDLENDSKKVSEEALSNSLSLFIGGRHCCWRTRYSRGS